MSARAWHWRRSQPREFVVTVTDQHRFVRLDGRGYLVEQILTARYRRKSARSRYLINR